MSKFSDELLNTCDGTDIYSATEAKIGSYDVQYQKWRLDDMHGETMVFCNEDIEDLNLNQVIDIVKHSKFAIGCEDFPTLVDTRYTYINFNFEGE